MFTGFLVADMVYLLADVSAAHTRPLQLPPLGHLDSNETVALQRSENVLHKDKSSSPLQTFALA
ncbi:hypothetical protein CP335_13015 [Pseudomonas fluorescens]|uniref:Uncharacterized protein n=2 Tax=Pseudomonas fluorescens group TaxID=136843 RepID=A0A2A2PMD1_9PSED|nr:hypothetical protein CKQ68_14295 [Pseudomonas moraviensis]PAW56543.1 hypothetical protein CKQ80_14915 [Pseudomonas moraviensis]PCM49256.1 hypothetical protein CP335_13015 [Pseudomonas fluorescens]